MIEFKFDNAQYFLDRSIFFLARTCRTISNDILIHGVQPISDTRTLFFPILATWFSMKKASWFIVHRLGRLKREIDCTCIAYVVGYFHTSLRVRGQCAETDCNKVQYSSVRKTLCSSRTNLSPLLFFLYDKNWP